MKRKAFVVTGVVALACGWTLTADDEILLLDEEHAVQASAVADGEVTYVGTVDARVKAGAVDDAAGVDDAEVEQDAADEEIARWVAVYDINGQLSETGQPSQGLLGPDFSQGMPLTILDVATSLAAAAEDAEVKGVVVEVDQAGMNLAQIEEMRRGLLAVRAAGKDVWIYADYYTPATALIGSAATKFVLMPEAIVMFSGLHAESMYFKGALDKLGVEADVVHIGDFKSFGEQFYRSGPSEPAQKQTDALLDGIFVTITEGVAAGRKLDVAVVKKAVDAGMLNATELKEMGLVDELIHRSDFLEAMEAHFGDDADYDWGYGMDDRSGPEVEGFMDLMKLMFSKNAQVGGGKPYVGVVPLQGGISDASIEPVRDAVRKMTNDKNARALVLRVDSPGGSALSSEVLWEALEEWKETDRPFVVSMGGVAASGGYYIAAGADKIYAESGTITGSIGVVGMKLVMANAFAKMGITVHEDKRGEHANVYSSQQKFTEEQRQMVRDSMLDIYGTFLDHVATGREGKLTQDVKALAGGRVYTGADALKIGLIDELGGIGEAVSWVKSSAELDPEMQVLILPKPKTPFDGLFQNPGERDKDDEVIRMASAEGKSGIAGQIQQQIIEAGLGALLTEQQLQQIRVSLEQLRSVEGGAIQLVAPPLPTIGLK